MKTIKLTRGQVALVDDADFELLNQYKWSLAIGSNAGYSFYAKTRIKNKTVYMHRMILNPTDKQTVDHDNGNGLDNRRSNIRLCNSSQNQANRGRQKNCNSGFKGVSWHKEQRKWVAWIQFSKKHIYLGRFDNKIGAAVAYDNAAIKYHGEFARTNFNGALNKDDAIAV